MKESSISVVALQGRPTWQLVLSLAWPVLLQQTLVFIVTLSDAILAGRFVPLEGGHIGAQSALTTATYLTWLISSYTVLVTVGSIALVSRFTGAEQHEEAVHATNQTIVLSLLLGIPAGILGLIATPSLLAALQLQPSAIDFAVDYLQPLFIALPMQIIMQGGIACLIGRGDTRPGMWVLTFVACLNIPLSWAFFHGWGPFPTSSFPGIAMGTACSHVLGGLLVLLILTKGRSGLRISGELLKPHLGLLRRMIRISAPAGIDSLVLMVGQLWFLSIVNRLSVTESAAHGIALRWEGISYLAGMAFGTAAMTLVGQNLGANRPEQASKSGWTALALGCAVMCALGIVFFVLARPMFRAFCPHDHQAPVIDAGVPVLRLIAFAMAPLAVTIVFTQSLRGAGDTRVPVVITAIGFFLIRAPLAIYLTNADGWNLGLYGAWLAMCVDIIARALFMLWRFQSGRWQRIEV